MCLANPCLRKLCGLLFANSRFRRKPSCEFYLSANSTCLRILSVLFVLRPYEYFTEREKELYKIDEEALILLTMAIPNDIYNRVDNRNSAKEIWDELARQFEGSEASIQVKQNMCINAYEGFHANEGETLLDTYNRYNIILNDLRRNNITKSASEINYKFIKNLNLEWKNFAINLQMSKNMAQENVTDIFSTLSQHKDEVRSINNESNDLKDLVALIAGKGKCSSSGHVSSSKSKKKVSKAFVTELTDSDYATSEEELEVDSDNDIQRFSDNLALITRQFKRSFGKKKYYSKLKYEGYKKDKSELRYNPKYGRRDEKKREERRKERRKERREKRRKKRRRMKQEDASTVECLDTSPRTASLKDSRTQSTTQGSP
ncbi:hypothetical protein L6452_34427 [Arctium lappa]|uniref:Uncharacterized protein n=1 Tax=Arctium lappa TaxID=4217 RepID=A0ACB8YI76_ARCLA|nr:hypothetical protein L6452_34427 [Arctium lappa]